jgi:hypothetical protein
VNKKRAMPARDRDLEKTIAGLFQAIDELKSKKLVSISTLDLAKDLAQTWQSEFGNVGNPLLVLLAGLVVAQERRIEDLAKRCIPFGEAKKLTSKQQYDIGRRDVPTVGEIEWEFGGVRPPGTSDMNDSAMNCLKPPEPPTCLDDIFGGNAVNMQGLVRLFGRDRHPLSKIARVRTKQSQETLYDYRAVTAIMDVLLNEKPRKRRRSTPGRPLREPWLTDPPPAPDWRPINTFWDCRHYCRAFRNCARQLLRSRVLSGIERRIDSLSENVPKHIKSAFLIVTRRHGSDSG